MGRDAWEARSRNVGLRTVSPLIWRWRETKKTYVAMAAHRTFRMKNYFQLAVLQPNNMVALGFSLALIHLQII